MSFCPLPRCVFTPQDAHLFSETVCDNILLGVSDGRAVLDAAIRSAVLEADVDEQLSKESVREVIEEALSKRDVLGAAFRAEANEKLALQVKQAVMEGVTECQR